MMIRLSFAFATSLFSLSIQAFEFDPLLVRNETTQSLAHTSYQGENFSCRTQFQNQSLSLHDIVHIALCNNPLTKISLAGILSQSAQVGIAKSSYLPTASLTSSVSKGNDRTIVKDIALLSYDVDTTIRANNLNFNWLLFDFGYRSANLASARALLNSAVSNNVVTVQEVILSASKSYYDLLSALELADATTESELVASKSLEISEVKYKAGIGTLADFLQARTEYTRAKLTVSNAKGQVKKAQGDLAFSTGLKMGNSFSLIREDFKPSSNEFLEAIDVLIQQTLSTHPALDSVEFQVESAKEKAKAARAEGLPTVSLTGGLSQANQNRQRATETSTRSIGIQVKIPLLEGFSRYYRIEAAEALIDSKQAELQESIQKISLEIWRNYHLVSTEYDNLNLSEELVKASEESFQIAQGRYKAGIGSIIELLTAQKTLADARQHRVSTLFNWRISRLKLYASLGVLTASNF
jgi:outer membrane protein